MDPILKLFSNLLGLRCWHRNTARAWTPDHLCSLADDALFVGWVAYFAYVLFRSITGAIPRRATKASRTTLPVTSRARCGGEGILLVGLAIPLWARTVDKLPAEKDSTVIQIVAQQFDWNVRYPARTGVWKTGHALGFLHQTSSEWTRTIRTERMTSRT